MGYARSQQNTIFHAVVAKDGTGDYTTVQSAIDAVPENLKSPWLIFVKNGSYEEQVIIPQNKPFIHLIGQDKERTIIHLKLNVLLFVLLYNTHHNILNLIQMNLT